MDQVTAPELQAGLALAAARPAVARALLATVRARADTATAALADAWASPRAGADSGELTRSLAVALAEQAAHRPGLAGDLRAWLGAALASAPADVANAVGGDARVHGTVVQAHGIHGGVHIHPAAPGTERARAVPRQIPAVPAHFTNRERELAALDRTAATSPDGPVLAVISGPAGVGKTTLARRWLLGLADAFPDGQFYADLRGHSDSDPARPGELLGQLLRAVGEDRVPADLGEQSALWRSATAGARIALLLDNAVSAAQVRPLLPGGARALTAVTSRGRLSGLGMDGAAFHPLDVLATHEAVELLSRRIGADRVSREPEAALSVARACAGLPLAVCVAAARVAARPRQPLAAMAGALDGRGGGGALDALRVEGEYAVRGALDTSYRLLPPEHARGYRMLGLAPVPLLGVEVAAEACALRGDEADRLLDELAEVNLLEDLGPDPRTGTGRYRFHDLVKSHAGQLAADHEGRVAAEAAVRRVVDFYLYAATEAESLLTPSHRILPRRYARHPAQRPPFTDAPGALRWFDAERTHLMAALRTAAGRGWDDTAWMLADAMFPLFLRLRPYDLWIEAHEIGLAAARRAGDRAAESQMLTSGGTGLRNAGRHDEAVAWFGQALEVARERVASLESGRAPGPDSAGQEERTAARRAEAQALHGLGQSHRLAGRLAEATRYFRLALPLREAIGYRRGAALTRICLGDVALADGRPHEALPQLDAARVELLAEDDPYDAARALAFLGQAALRCAGDDASAVESAEAQLKQAVREFEETGSVHWQARVLEMLGEAAEERREPERARRWYEQSLARYASVSAPDVRRIQERLRGRGEALGPE